MHALLDALRGAHRNPEQFYAVAKFFRGTQILRRDRRNAFDVDRALRDLGAKGEAGQYRQFLRGVMAIDVEGRVGFRISQPLCILQAFGERPALLLHPGQDVVTSAVEDAVTRLTAVPAKPSRRVLM